MNIKEYKEFLTPTMLEEQENLSKEILDTLNVTNAQEQLSVRPEANFIDLMKWAENNFKKSLKDQNNLNRYVHNRIIIDGQFLKFCQEYSISVTCLYKDSVISWKTDNGYEKFFIQGAFLIKSKNVEFLHFATWHKGNQNEDEISFFIVCSNSNYLEYIKLRNSFDEWIQKRDRSNLHIRVVDGEDIPYTKDHTWGDLFLPSDIKTELQQLVENFLASKEFYNSNRIPWKRGVLLYGQPGNGKTSIIKTVMSMYNFKPVTIVSGAPDDAIREAFAYAEEQSPSLLYFEDLDSMLEKVDVSTFLNLMDGISAKNGLLVIATANDVRKLKTNITDRPSRFDRKFEIPQPDQEMAHIYLKRWFGITITTKKCRELAKTAVKAGFSYVHLKDLYISSMFAALSQNRKVPTERDIDSALNRLIKEKTSLNGSKLVDTDKYFK